MPANLDFWKERWRSNETAWHQESVETFLIRHFPENFKGNVLIPLCGKSLDIRWISDRATKVIGVEASPLACENFFKEQNISYRHLEIDGFLVFQSQRIEIWCGDFFKVPVEKFPPIDFVYDRAALIALPPETRKLYVEKCLAFLKGTSSSELKIFLIGREGSPREDGPPFPITENDVDDLYIKASNIRVLERQNRKSRKDPSISVTEIAYLISFRKSVT